jgi:predicted nuclease with RNAse H fold
VRRNSCAVAGIDLAGVSHRPSGCCLLDGLKADTKLLYTDEEIMDWLRKEKPELIAIDAPLTLPPGRKSIDERNESHYRPCDMELRRRKIPFFPITLGPMRVLTKRGIKLRKILEAEGFRVVEIYPGGAQDVWNIPRARRSLSGLQDGLRKLGITGLKKQCTDHELDAASGALAGHLFLQEKAEVYGDFESGAIIMPPQS